MRSEKAVGVMCAVGGVIFLLAGTLLHPMSAQPNDPVTTFTEYAADQLWVASHLMQLLGMAAIVVALLQFAQELKTEASATAVRIANAAAVASLALAAALQAVDGIALKVMVDTWAAAPGADKSVLFQSAFAVRQVEIGFASMLSLSLGLTVILYGVAIFQNPLYPKWFASIAIIGGIPTMLAGIVIANMGFSELAMAINMPANMLLLVWMLALAALLARSNRSASRSSRSSI